MATICTNAFGEDWIVEFDYTITNPGCQAQISGPPERCYPAEPMEYEVELISLRRDLTPSRKEMVPREAEPVVACPVLREAIEQWLMESEQAYDVICREEGELV